MAEKADLESLEEAVGRAIHRIADLGKQNAKLQKELARAKKKATSAKSGGGMADWLDWIMTRAAAHAPGAHPPAAKSAVAG